MIQVRLHMWQVNCNYGRDNNDTNVHYIKNQETLQSMRWNVTKLISSHVFKKTARENGKDNRDL